MNEKPDWYNCGVIVLLPVCSSFLKLLASLVRSQCLRSDEELCSSAFKPHSCTTGVMHYMLCAKNKRESERQESARTFLFIAFLLTILCRAFFSFDTEGCVSGLHTSTAQQSDLTLLMLQKLQ